MPKSLFDLEIPILQSPIGGASTPELCAAVSSSGGMGGMALTWTDPAAAKAKVQAVLTATNRSFYANFALAFEPLSLPAALEAGVPVVTFSWGNAAAHLRLVRSFGARVGIQVANAEGAKAALDLGADFLICQGYEAGGHVQSTTPLRELLLEIVAVSRHVPVVASGGIATGAAIAQALQAGASAVAMGTRFLATRESGAHEVYKKQIASPLAKRTALTICFDRGWPNAPHRVLRNATLESWEAAGCPSTNRPGEGDTVARSAQGDPIPRYSDTQPLVGTTGLVEEMCLYAGTGCSEIRDIPPAGDLLRRLWAEASGIP